VYAAVNAEFIEPGIAVLAEVFAAERFRREDFLSWLYAENPAGPAICVTQADGSGHVACIPQFYLRGGDRVKLGLMVNAAVREPARGRGVFRQMVQRLGEEAEAAGMAQIFAVANAHSTPALLRLGYRRIGALPVCAGVFRPDRGGDISEIGCEEVPACLVPHSQCWTEALLRWRMHAPHQSYHLFACGDVRVAVTMVSYGPVRVGVILKVWAAQPVANVRGLLRGIAGRLGTPFLVYAGFNPQFRMRGVQVPRLLLPAPLNLLALPLRAGQEAWVPEVFELLDFDAY
jgi:GNAT superfamily N-acetyltransferase